MSLKLIHCLWLVEVIKRHKKRSINRVRLKARGRNTEDFGRQKCSCHYTSHSLWYLLIVLSMRSRNTPTTSPTAHCLPKDSVLPLYTFSSLKVGKNSFLPYCLWHEEDFAVRRNFRPKVFMIWHFYLTVLGWVQSVVFETNLNKL